MALTKDFKLTIKDRAQRDPEFRQAMLIEAINELLADNVGIAKALLRDYINATISFEPLALRISKNSKSLQRMFGPNGNPTTDSLFAVIHTLQTMEGITLQVRVVH